ncbi:homeobox-leucine zipper protein 4 [Striga asiatica]|uniref:Homeobox-leucine zipper protein 4 n=1 Tax=Striga asiatica TaxID=4170 RepID=A0A5A7P4T9_STRAF|nr:homeobox-leucine zipper protein 4 [Striga asiatica]
MLTRGPLMSHPTKKQFGFKPKYFPFPQPESSTSDPEGREFKKAWTLGHLAKRVELKWGAIASYTRWTYFFSISGVAAWGLEGGGCFGVVLVAMGGKMGNSSVSFSSGMGGLNSSGDGTSKERHSEMPSYVERICYQRE